jgi:hypothetical protein
MECEGTPQDAVRLLGHDGGEDRVAFQSNVAQHIHG